MKYLFRYGINGMKLTILMVPSSIVNFLLQKNEKKKKKKK